MTAGCMQEKKRHNGGKQKNVRNGSRKRKTEDKFMKARFTPSLITGNEMIDSHHKELIKRANDCSRRLRAGRVRKRC